MGARKEDPGEIMLGWLRWAGLPDELQDAVLAEPDHELVPLVLGRWLLFDRQVRLRPQTDPAVIRSLRRSARAAGKLLGGKVTTSSHDTGFYVYARERSEFAAALTYAIRARRRTRTRPRLVEREDD